MELLKSKVISQEELIAQLQASILLQSQAQNQLVVNQAQEAQVLESLLEESSSEPQLNESINQNSSQDQIQQESFSPVKVDRQNMVVSPSPQADTHPTSPSNEGAKSGQFMLVNEVN